MDADLAQKLIKGLDELVKVDPQAMFDLVETRVPCNQHMVNHPTVQTTGDMVPRVGLLGILNGICGAFADGPLAGWGPITAVYSADGRSLLGFKLTESAPPPSPPRLQESLFPLTEEFLAALRPYRGHAVKVIQHAGLTAGVLHHVPGQPWRRCKLVLPGLSCRASPDFDQQVSPEPGAIMVFDSHPDSWKELFEESKKLGANLVGYGDTAQPLLNSEKQLYVDAFVLLRNNVKLPPPTDRRLLPVTWCKREAYAISFRLEDGRVFSVDIADTNALKGLWLGDPLNPEGQDVQRTRPA